MSCKIVFNPFTGNFDYVGGGSSTPSTSDDFHSGYSVILPLQTVVVLTNKQMINFGGLTLDGTLTVDGDVWLV